MIQAFSFFFSSAFFSFFTADVAAFISAAVVLFLVQSFFTKAATARAVSGFL